MIAYFIVITCLREEEGQLGEGWFFYYLCLIIMEELFNQ